MFYVYEQIKRQPFFFYGLFILLITSLALCLFTGKGWLFIAANPSHSPVADVFFVNYTFLGDGLFVLTVGLFFLLVNEVRVFIQITAGYLLSGLAVQVVKHTLAEPRPRNFFPEGTYANFKEGITNSGFDSFPSGHTASIFALAVVLALYSAKKGVGLLCLLLAVIVAYSRVYLGHHFVHDVVAGAFTGVLSGLLVMALIRDVQFYQNKSLLQIKWGI